MASQWLPSWFSSKATPDPAKDDDDAESTPKAKPSIPTLECPPLSLNSNDEDTKLMPPPSRPKPDRPKPAATSLSVPTTGPSPQRGRPGDSTQRAGKGLTPNRGKTNARGQVTLAPGHSPLDWSALSRSKNLSGVASLQRVKPSELRKMTGRKGKPAWSSWQGKVYNITPYLPFHPGGEAELLRAAGRDGTALFMDIHPWVNWENMLESCLVGALVPEESSTLDEMD
ncbi:cytochrome b5 [Piedraia hortae CBS 480.64]|uniref:Cytochrome b5 n=1 Tax=Piedraia hortae CBS 480.64 TaxID=1314780 RepID=A0A6A7BTH1_9PEZI|nr:cytochrome b5 [Piedraia hortae CBS 480.64]